MQQPDGLDDDGVHASSRLLMLGVPASFTKADLLKVIPEKAVVDKLVAQWFNSSNPILRKSMVTMLRYCLKVLIVSSYHSLPNISRRGKGVDDHNRTCSTC